MKHTDMQQTQALKRDVRVLVFANVVILSIALAAIMALAVALSGR
jgi:hypothetical protein